MIMLAKYEHFLMNRQIGHIYLNSKIMLRFYNISRLNEDEKSY